jgi:hypothetical protein
MLHRPQHALALTLFVAVGCGSESKTAGDPSTTGARAPTEYDENGCVVPSNGIQDGQECIRTLSARVVDLDGAPVADLTTTACGDGCSYGKTGSDGSVSMDVRRYMSRGAIMLHGRSRWASYYSLLGASGDVDKGSLFLPAMPWGEGAPLPADGAAGTVAFGDVTLTLAEGTKVRVDLIELETEEEQLFRVVSVPLDKAPPFVAEAGADFAALYALTPYGTRISPPAAIELANTTGLAPGTAVELFAQGARLDDANGPFGGFSKMADAHVSEDGKTIRSDEGEGLPEITWLGVRARATTE